MKVVAWSNQPRRLRFSGGCGNNSAVMGILSTTPDVVEFLGFSANFFIFGRVYTIECNWTARGGLPAIARRITVTSTRLSHELRRGTGSFAEQSANTPSHPLRL
jgi:hypothetical protein